MTVPWAAFDRWRQSSGIGTFKGSRILCEKMSGLITDQEGRWLTDNKRADGWPQWQSISIIGNKRLAHQSPFQSSRMITTTTKDLPTELGYVGLTSLLATESKTLHLEDIEADIKGKKETLPDVLNNANGSNPDHEPLSLSDIEKTIAGYSKGISEGTESDYRRFANQLLFWFLVTHVYNPRLDLQILVLLFWSRAS